MLEATIHETQHKPATLRTRPDLKLKQEVFSEFSRYQSAQPPLSNPSNPFWLELQKSPAELESELKIEKSFAQLESKVLKEVFEDAELEPGREEDREINKNEGKSFFVRRKNVFLKRDVMGVREQQERRKRREEKNGKGSHGAVYESDMRILGKEGESRDGIEKVKGNKNLNSKEKEGEFEKKIHHQFKKLEKEFENKIPSKYREKYNEYGEKVKEGYKNFRKKIETPTGKRKAMHYLLLAIGFYYIFLRKKPTKIDSKNLQTDSFQNKYQDFPKFNMEKYFQTHLPHFQNQNISSLKESAEKDRKTVDSLLKEQQELKKKLLQMETLNQNQIEKDKNEKREIEKQKIQNMEHEIKNKNKVVESEKENENESDKAEPSELANMILHILKRLKKIEESKQS